MRRTYNSTAWAGVAGGGKCENFFRISPLLILEPCWRAGNDLRRNARGESGPYPAKKWSDNDGQADVALGKNHNLGAATRRSASVQLLYRHRLTVYGLDAVDKTVGANTGDASRCVVRQPMTRPLMPPPLAG